MTLEMGQLWHSLGALGSALALWAPQSGGEHPWGWGEREGGPAISPAAWGRRGV